MITHLLQEPEKQPYTGNLGTQQKFVDEYLSLAKAAIKQTDKVSIARSTDMQPEKVQDNSTNSDFKFDGKLFLIGGAANKAWQDLVSILPKDAKKKQTEPAKTRNPGFGSSKQATNSFFVE